MLAAVFHSSVFLELCMQVKKNWCLSVAGRQMHTHTHVTVLYELGLRAHSQLIVFVTAERLKQNTQPLASLINWLNIHLFHYPPTYTHTHTHTHTQNEAENKATDQNQSQSAR